MSPVVPKKIPEKNLQKKQSRGRSISKIPAKVPKPPLARNPATYASHYHCLRENPDNLRRPFRNPPRGMENLAKPA